MKKYTLKGGRRKGKPAKYFQYTWAYLVTKMLKVSVNMLAKILSLIRGEVYCHKSFRTPGENKCVGGGKNITFP